VAPPSDELLLAKPLQNASFQIEPIKIGPFFPFQCEPERFGIFCLFQMETGETGLDEKQNNIQKTKVYKV
jgi:hypothetical protein